MSKHDEDLDPPVNFDLERMKKAVEGPFITLPEGLGREEMREYLHNEAVKRRDKREGDKP